MLLLHRQPGLQKLLLAFLCFNTVNDFLHLEHIPLLPVLLLRLMVRVRFRLFGGCFDGYVDNPLQRISGHLVHRFYFLDVHIAYQVFESNFSWEPLLEAGDGCVRTSLWKSSKLLLE